MRSLLEFQRLSRRTFLGAAGCLAAGAAGGCGAGDSRGSGGPLRITATTGMVAEVGQRVGGDLVKVQSLMGPGVDPHLYKASEGDLARLSDADLILYNGLNLEGKMGDVLSKMSSGSRLVVAIAEAVDKDRLLAPPEFGGHPDPHIWFDVALWTHTLQPVVETLSRLRPDAAESFKLNAEAYEKELAELDAFCRREVATIPQARRVLITAHDAFGYFGRAYEVEVMGLQGISTLSEYSLRDVERLVDTIVSRGIKAVFVESSVSSRSIEAVVAGCRAKNHPIRIGGTLFSDAMGAAGTVEGTYQGMVRHNVKTIVEALR